jgi:hypothetical protein
VIYTSILATSRHFAVLNFLRTAYSEHFSAPWSSTHKSFAQRFRSFSVYLNCISSGHAYSCFLILFVRYSAAAVMRDGE